MKPPAKFGAYHRRHPVLFWNQIVSHVIIEFNQIPRRCVVYLKTKIIRKKILFPQNVYLELVVLVAILLFAKKKWNSNIKNLLIVKCAKKKQLNVHWFNFNYILKFSRTKFFWNIEVENEENMAQLNWWFSVWIQLWM